MDKAINTPISDRQSQIESSVYKRRFENLFRVAKKITSSLNIGEILEIIRDEARATIPHIHEVCLLLVDQDAANYTRPLYCPMGLEKVNCQLCKKGRKTFESAMNNSSKFLCFIPSQDSGLIASQEPIGGIEEVALPIYHEGKPLAVLDVISKENQPLQQSDLEMLSDMVELATNVLVNAKQHWRMSQEKLTVDQILAHLKAFVPHTVQKIVEKNPSAPAFEKREADVSVLFLDVAEYTRISEFLTQEQVNFIIEKYFSSFIDIVYEYAGDINETAGDGLMIIFSGQPKETARNAVKTALAISKKTTELNDELANRFQPIYVNMGINSGKASVGMTRFEGASGMRMTYTASGPMTNLASRIAAAAQDGDILLGKSTATLLDDEFALFDKGCMQFKNISEDIHVFRLKREEEI